MKKISSNRRVTRGKGEPPMGEVIDMKTRDTMTAADVAAEQKRLAAAARSRAYRERKRLAREAATQGAPVTQGALTPAVTGHAPSVTPPVTHDGPVTPLSVMRDAPVTVPPPVDIAHVMVGGVSMLVALAIGAGAYTVLWLILLPLRGALAASLLSLVPMGVEMLAGQAAHRASERHKRFTAAMWVAVMLGCAAVDIIAAKVAPAVTARQQQQDILRDQQEHQGGEVKLQAAAEGSGRRAKLEHEKNQGAALALQKSRDEAAQKLTQERLALARQTTGGEEWLFIGLAIFGAIGASRFLPQLEAFLRALAAWRGQRAPKRRRRVKAAGGAP